MDFSRYLQAARQGCVDPIHAARLHKDSPSPPAAPDYTGAAIATAQGNADAARVAAKANRVSQYTPYGNLVYSQGGGGRTFDQGGYDAAMKAYQGGQGAQGQASGSNYDPNGIFGGIFGGTGGGGGGKAPNRDDFYSSNGDPDSWRADVNLSPTGQKLLDLNNASQIGLGEQQNQALGRVNQTLSQPFDASSVGQLADQSYAAQTARLDPQWAQASQQQASTLANQGLSPGGEAYDNSMRTFNQGKNDAYTQARLAAQSTMPQTYQLANAIRNQPLNELNALRTGSQVTNPQFQSNIPQQQTTTGPNLLGAAQSQYGAANDAYNSQVGQNNAMMGGLFSLGGSIAGALPWGTMISDRRLKRDIRKLRDDPRGFGVYEFRYLWDDERRVGVMADEVAHIPGVVMTLASGYQAVDYGRL